MTRTALLLGVAALGWSAAASADTASEIAAIEQAWGEAFMKKDRAFIEKLVAPEFKLMGSEGGEVEFTPRERWLANYERFVFHEFEVRTIDVVDSGDTAVATVTGRWKVGRVGLPGTRETGFILSDTFVRRGGAWQVVYRHSAPAPLPAAAPAERGR